MSLLEREAELDTLSRTFASAAGGRGSVVLVSGEAGIGKTSLVRAAVSGDALISPSITVRLLEHLSPPAPTGDDGGLSPRELEVVKLVARGLTNAEIADVLVVSPATVKTHVARVLEKLEVRDRVQATALAYEADAVG